MSALIKRNLLLYFRNHSGLIFSLMGAMISFILYLIFLKKSIQSSWTQIPNSALLLDEWLIGGTLAITGITTTLAGLTRVVADRESDVQQDLLQTDTGNVRLTLSYLASASLIGWMMQVIMFSVMLTYFYLEDSLTITWEIFGVLLILMALNALLSTALNAIIINFVNHMSSLTSLSTVVGTAAGFLVGGLIPIGTLPTFAQHLIKLTPGSYIAALNRQVLMKNQLKETFGSNIDMRDNFEKLLGVRLDWSGLLNGSTTLTIIVVTLLAATLLALLPQLVAGRKRRKLTA